MHFQGRPFVECHYVTRVTLNELTFIAYNIFLPEIDYRIIYGIK